MIFFEYLILGYFLYVVGYTACCSLAGMIRSFKSPLSDTWDFHKIAILVPAYKEDAVILSATTRNLMVNYPKESFELIIIADSLKKESLEGLRKMPVSLIEVDFEQSTKVKSLNFALNKIEEQFDLALILDADNVMKEDFLQKINASYASGLTALQGRRTAKNKNTDFAVLDGLSEMINNHIYREGNCGLGWSSSLIGSGMAFEFDLLKSCLAKMESVGGFDRELEVLLVEKGHKVTYVPDAWVYDEKVEKAEVFAGQRKRWIASQYHYLFKFWRLGMKALFRGKLALFNSTILRNIQLPRVINLGLLGLLAMTYSFLSSWLTLSPLLWWALLGVLLLSFVPAVPMSYYNKDFFKSLAKLPQAFGIMFSLLFKLKGANKKFIHTPHGQNPSE
ncbi:MAG: glycosyltransferase family 2 protein [Bacteroidia bacterium]|nr:glycosyltransferase family 2 protein [Bacteroidia bacterium]